MVYCFSDCSQYLLAIITIMLWIISAVDSTLTPRAPNFQYFERWDNNVYETELTEGLDLEMKLYL